MEIYILSIGLLIFLSYYFSALYEKTRVPDVLLLMIVGILAGPVAQLIRPDFFGDFGRVLTTLALIVILFEGGTTIDLKSLGASIGPTLLLTLSSFLVTAGMTTVFGATLLGLQWLPAMILGVILGGTSSAVVVPMVKGLNLRKPSGTILILESALTDVLCIVFTGALVDAYLKGEGANGKIAGSIVASLVFAVLIGVIGALLWLFAVARIGRFRRSMFSTVAAVLIGYGLAEILGYSGAITALSFGFTLTNYSSFRFDRIPLLQRIRFVVIHDHEKIFYGEIVFILKTFFFVFLGLSIRFDHILSFFAALLLVAMIYLARLFITRFVVSRKTPKKEAAMISVMAPKGLAAAVLAGIPLQRGVNGGEIIQNIVYDVVLLSIFVTAVIVPLIDKTSVRMIYDFIFRRFANDQDSVSKEEANGEERHQNNN